MNDRVNYEILLHIKQESTHTHTFTAYVCAIERKMTEKRIHLLYSNKRNEKTKITIKSF